MEDTAKYLIHADFVADGVVERSDVVGAVFGQTEGLLGDDLDIRDLQHSSKLGRIDVEVRHDHGQSIGDITIASSLDRVETATLAAALEAIERIGPSQAAVEVGRIEDVRAAKRRRIVDRATELFATAFDEGTIDSEAILEQVRERVRVGDITEYAGLPAGPNVETSDAVVVVEGRADVLTLLKYGVKNAVAVEGTNVPEAVAELTKEKTVTAFLDGDRGGDLIRRELEQVGEIDFVALAPEGRSVEDLSRAEVDRALRNKVEASRFAAGEVPAATDGSSAGAATESAGDVAAGSAVEPDTTDRPDAEHPEGAAEAGQALEPPAEEPAAESVPTLADQVAAVETAERARLLDADLAALADVPAADAFDAVLEADPVPHTVLVDGPITQRLLDAAAQRGVARIVGREIGAIVKRPASVRTLTFEDLDG